MEKINTSTIHLFASWISRSLAHGNIQLIVIILLFLISLSPAIGTAQNLPDCSDPHCAPVMIDDHEITFAGVRYNYPSQGQSTWYYCICSGNGPAISHLTFGMCNTMSNANVLDAGTWGPTANDLNSGANTVFGNDPTTGVTGLKFDEGFADGECQNFYFTIDENYAVDDIDMGIKAGTNNLVGTTCGPDPDCSLACIDPEVTLDVVNVSCPGENDGSVTANVNGNSTYTYEWNTGATTQTISNLSPGQYIVTVTDQNGDCSTVDTAVVNENPDNTPPTINCTSDVTIECDESITPSNTGTVTATDNCDDNLNITYSDEVFQGGCDQEFEIERTFTVVDDAGNSASCVQVITLVDNSAPVLISVPADTTVECNSIPSAASVTASDNCGVNITITLDESITDGTCPDNYTINRTWTATDECGNSASATQIISVIDTIAPDANNLPPVYVECSSDIPGVDITDVEGETDNCTENPVVTHVGDESDGNTCPEIITRTYRVTDDCGNNTDVTQIITVNDTTPPTADDPTSVFVQCWDEVPAPSISVVADEADNCTANPVVTYLGADTTATTCPAIITRTYSVTDECNNSTTVSQTITVHDTTAPTASNPTSVIVECWDEVPAPSLSVVTDEADNCTANPVVTYLGADTTATACPAIITRTYSITDECENVSIVTHTITVSDTTAPTASNATSVFVECWDEVPAPSISVITDEADNCTANPVVTYLGADTSASTCPVVITRNYSVADECLNSIVVTQTITVSDTTPPTASNPTSVSVECWDEVPAPSVSVVTDESDNCTVNPVVTYLGADTSATTCPAVITRLYSVTDECLNSITVTQIITVNDTTSPTASNPTSVFVECWDEVPAPSISVVTDEADNCTANPVVTYLGADTSATTCPAVITRLYSVTDECLNSITVTQIITVNDTTPPTASNPTSVFVECWDEVPAPSISVVADEADNCTANPVVTYLGADTTATTCPAIITRTYSVTDECNNSTIVSQTITVHDTTAPTASNPTSLFVECWEDVPAPSISVVTDEADNCTANPVVNYLGADTTATTCPAIITRTFSITDECENVSIVAQTITVSDTTAPTASNATSVFVECWEDVPAPSISVVTDEADNCTANPVVTYLGADTSASTCPVVITRNYSVADECLNSIIVTQTITVSDTTPPTASNPTSVFVECWDEVPAPSISVVTDEADNCTVNPVVTYLGADTTATTCPAVITRSYSVTDECLNSITVTQIITVNDTTPPTASNPTSVFVQCWEDVPAPSISVVTDEADNCTANPVVTYLGADTTATTCPAVITRLYSVTDECLNSITVTQIITVNDTTPPTASNPTAVFVQCWDEVPAPSISVVTDEADNCTANPIVTYLGADTSTTACPATIVRSFNITDECLNSTVVTQIITVNDTTPPTASNPTSVFVQCWDEVPAPSISVVTDEADNCTVNPIVTYLGADTTATTCPAVITRLYSVTDECLNSTVVTQIITVNDTTPPTASNPTSVSVECWDEVPAPSVSVVTDETDNCTVSPVVTYLGADTTASTCPAIITRLYSVTDECLNSITVTQIITVNDTTPPTASNPTTVSVQCWDEVPAPSVSVVTDEADNCTVNPVVAYLGADTSATTCPAVITRLYSVTDECLNSITVTQTITVNDTTPPTASNPTTVSVQCWDEVPAPSISVVTDEADNCTVNPVVTYLGADTTATTCPAIITRLYSVTDECLNSITVTQTITVNDTTPPTATNPTSVFVQCWDEVPTPSISVVTDEEDNCTTNPVVTYLGADTSATTCPAIITRSYSVTDECLNSIIVTQIITVNDTTPPTASNPTTVFVQCWDEVPAPSISVVTDEADNCTANPVVTYLGADTSATTCPAIITRSYSVTDECLNSTVVTQTITVNDTTPPTASNPTSVFVQCWDEVPAPSISVVTDEADNCTVNPVVTYLGADTTATTCPAVITRSYSVTDECLNSITVTQIITVNDTTPPTASNPTTVSVQCWDEVPAPSISVVTDEADNCTVNPVVTYLGADTTATTCPAVITRSYSVTDECLNSITVTQIISVNDTTPPTVDDLSTIILQCTDEIPAADISIVTGEADNCTVDPIVSHIGDVSNGNSCPEVITRTYQVMDDCGNTVDVIQTIVINDTIPPTADSLGSIFVQCADEIPAADISVVTGEADNCTVDPIVSHIGDVSDGNSCPEVITRTYQVADDCGNTIEVQQTITINDTIPPTASNPDTLILDCSEGVPAPDPTVVIDETDNCTSNPLVVHVSDDTTGTSCPITVTRIYSITDDCGNTTLVTQIIQLIDNTAPLFTVPGNVTINCGQDYNDLQLTGNVNDEVDNCDLTPSVSYVDDMSGMNDCGGTGQIMRTWICTDGCGNSNLQYQMINVIDESVPFLISTPQDTTIACDAAVPLEMPVVNDACSDATITYNDTYVNNPSCPQGGRIDRVFTISDDCGNSYVLLQQIDMVDTTAPEMEAVHPSLQTIDNGGTLEVNCQSNDLSWELPEFDISAMSATDNCGAVTINMTDSVVGQSNCQTDGYLLKVHYIFTAEDECSNVSTFEFFMEVVDKTPPVIFGVPEDITLNCSQAFTLDTPNTGNCEVTSEVYVMDECECAEIHFEEFITNNATSSCASYEIRRVWTGIDNCGNVRTEEQIISVIDNEGPTISLVEGPFAGIENDTTIDVYCESAGFPQWVNNLDENSVAGSDLCESGMSGISYSENLGEVQDCSNGYIMEWLHTWTLSDSCGNASTLNITFGLKDTTAPQIILRDREKAICFSDEIVAPEVVDACNVMDISFVKTRLIDPCAGVERGALVWTATDYCGNTSQEVQYVIEPDEVVYKFTGALEGHFSGDTILMDCKDAMDMKLEMDMLTSDIACYRTTNAYALSESNTPYTSCQNNIIGMSQYTWDFDNICGDHEQAALTVMMIDTTAPVIEGFQDTAIMYCGEPEPLMTITDNCTGGGTSMNIVHEQRSVQDSCEEYTVDREILLTDSCGNSRVYKQLVIVKNAGPRFIGLPSEVDAVCNNSELSNIRALDQCSGEEVPVAFEDLMTEECEGGTRTLRVYTAEGSCNTVSHDSIWILNQDEQGPSALINHPGIANAGNGGTIIVDCSSDRLDNLGIEEGSVSFTDACSEFAEVEFTSTRIFGECLKDGFLEEKLFQWTATDLCGNQSHFEVTARLVDNTGPEFVSFEENVLITCGETNQPDQPRALDACGLVTLSSVDDTLYQEDRLIIKRIWTAEDQCENITTKVQTITHPFEKEFYCEILTPEKIACNEKGVRIESDVTGGLAPYDYHWQVTGGACEIVSGQGTPTIIINMGFTDVEVTLTVTDTRGCVTVCYYYIECQYGEGNENNYSLYQNTPNPFEHSTIIGFEMADRAEATFTIYDAAGKRVKTITDIYEAGYNEVKITRADLTVSGVYFYDFVSGDFRGVKKMLVTGE